MIPFNLLRHGRRPATNRGRDWTDRHREFFAAWGYLRIDELPKDAYGNDEEPESVREEEINEDGIAPRQQMIANDDQRVELEVSNN